MISLENLSNKELREAIKNNILEVLNDNPDSFFEYFKYVFAINNNMVQMIMLNMFNDEFALNYPYELYNVFDFLIDVKNDNSLIERVPLSFYINHKDMYFKLFNKLLSNCNIFNIKSFIGRAIKKTRDPYFSLLLKLLNAKITEFVDAPSIVANIEDTSNLKEIYRNWSVYCDSYYRDSIYGTDDIEKCKDILCKKLYNVSFAEMTGRYYYYIISNRTTDLDNKIIYFEKLIKACTKEEIIQIYEETIDINSELKDTYVSIVKQIDVDSKKSFSDVSKYQVPQELEVKKINNVDVYDISEVDFNLIIHNVSAGLNNSDLAEVSCLDLSAWSSLSTKGSITISASEISNKYLGHLAVGYQNEQDVIFAFSDIPEEEILFSGIHDISLNTRVDDYSKLSPSDGKGQHFLANQLLTNCFNNYNEVVINRFLDKTKSEKRIPSYIVCYDSINELSLKYAEFFNIPILYIDTKKCAYKNAFDIKSKLENTHTSFDLLNNVNEYFSFICGLKYSNVLFEIVELNDWESIIIASIKKVIANAKDVDELKEILVILGYLKGNTSKYKIGIETTFNIVDRDFTEISNKYSNLHVKIESIIESINKRLLGISDSFENVDLLTDENSFKK